MARLLFPNPDGGQSEIELIPDADEVTIGRHPRCAVVIRNPSISRQHAKITHEHGQFVLHDLKSANGTFIGEERVTTRALEGPRVELQVGDVTVVFEDQPRVTAAKAVAREAKPRPKTKAARKKATDSRPAQVAEPAATPEAVADVVAMVPPSEPSAPDGAEGDAAELKSRLRHQTNEAKRLEAARAELEQQLRLLQQQHKEARELAEERAAAAEEAEARAEKLERRIEEFIRKESERADLLSNLKIQVVHKERQLEEMRKGLDLKEYDLQQLREEMQSIEDRYNEDNRIQADLEKRVNELREVIVEKENHIGDLRRMIDEKDYEMRQVQLGAGITGMDEERGKLLEDYYTAQREAERLRRENRQLRHAGAREEELEAAPATALESAAKDVRAAIAEPLESIRNEVRTCRSYLRDVEKGLKVYAGIDSEQLGAEKRKRLERHKPHEALSLVKEVLAILTESTEALENAVEPPAAKE